MIAHQRPDATRVAGFKAWLRLGYCVRKGETALYLWAPCPPSKAKLEQWRRDGANPLDEPRTRFKMSAVFDRAQVDEQPPPAEPVPLDPPAAAEIDGDELAAWKQPLERLAGELGSAVSYAPIDSGEDGFYQRKTKAIVVEASHPTNRQLKTLIHELAHALVHADRHDGDPELDKPAEEIVAETVAYTACSTTAIDPGGYSITYLASWAETAPDDTPERTAALIDRLARRIEDAVADVDVDGDAHTGEGS